MSVTSERRVESSGAGRLPKPTLESGIIVTNRRALTQNYGRQVEEVDAAIDALVTSRRGAGIQLDLFSLDDHDQLRPYGVPPVVDARDISGNDTTIRGICQALNPEYVLIVGSVDVVPHQILASSFSGSIETHVATDWPYGWLDPGGLDSQRPPRMVGRIPGITGSRNAQPQIAALRHATRTNGRTVADYLNPFVVCCESFRESTEETVYEALGSVDEVCSVPSPQGVDWSDEQVGRSLHIINCHGFPNTPFFSGRREKGPTCPALLPEQIDGRLGWGTVAAVTCCYGADLYAPLGAGSSTRYMPMCNAFLANGAIGYFGSTGSSHGGRFHPKEADLLVKEFVRTWLQGGSLGEASRHSILQLISSSSGLDPARVRKNAWQFILLGDPTARPSRDGSGPQARANL